jgi:hypothetical protein
MSKAKITHKTENANIQVRVTIVTMEKELSITHFEYVFEALGTQHAMCTRRIFIYGLSSFTVFFRIISQTAQFKKI